MFWQFHILKTLFQSLTRDWKKLGDFITPENCAILLSKMVESRSWWRSVVDKTRRFQYDTACIGYTQHQYPRRRLKIQRKHSIQNRLTCCFASETFLSDWFCPQHYVTGWIWTIKVVPASWPFFDKHWVVFNAKNLTKFLFRRTLTFTICLFTCWTVKLCKEKMNFICTLKKLSFFIIFA